MLYIFGGLPGTGKSTLASSLARERGAVYVRIDTIEQALRNAGVQIAGPEGYVAGYGIAADNLRLGREVVADSVNPLRVTREAWCDVAIRLAVGFFEIEVVCSDREEHRSRVETRTSDIPGLVLPTWTAVLQRHYEPWDREHLVIDTAGKSSAQSLAQLRLAVM